MAEHVLYANRSEWADITPLEQYENDQPLAPIHYTVEYKDATDYFRGIVKIGERSQRVLELTKAIIDMNPGHYSVWQYRYETLLALDADLEAELELMNSVAVEHLKTYQVWHHRRLLMMRVRKPAPELHFIANSFQTDAKNYHTWSYRQWLLAYFNQDDLWEEELDFVDTMLNQDIRNNSVWHHRFFVVFESGIREGEEDRERVLKRELIYVKQNISLAPNNPSAWNYLRGILDHNKIPYSRVIDFVRPYSVPLDKDAADLVDLENPPPSKGAALPCPQAIEFLADIYEAEGGDSTLKATELWKSLGNEHDTIRKRYWEHRIREALRKIQT
ncbi:farnesyltransferase geranylgeranyltransferase type i alpha subunit [Moniliophthora roreri MCA 2997]|uniref:Protein farnesyltransferase/geranylgeranyltransferase type-1 subunit alpha n=1 Tax=Moniliophthora roreri (strain MCA 2997) TaxID=1381753 RepID=V2X0T9_MONRO|nr:farnesyltransferase geranylgeranyltransferase type i alpha subunit [Moniliophthora roreri MCA 2997]